MATAVVADSALDRIRHRRDVRADLLDRHRLQISVTFECLVQIVDIRLMMLRAMDVHRGRVDRGFEGIFSVRKFWK